MQDDPWPGIVNHFESGKEVSGKIIRVLDKGIIIQLDMDVEGIIPFGKMSKKDRRLLASQYEVGANLSGIVMKVSPEDKKNWEDYIKNPSDVFDKDKTMTYF